MVAISAPNQRLVAYGAQSSVTRADSPRRRQTGGRRQLQQIRHRCRCWLQFFQCGNQGSHVVANAPALGKRTGGHRTAIPGICRQRLKQLAPLLQAHQQRVYRRQLLRRTGYTVNHRHGAVRHITQGIEVCINRVRSQPQCTEWRMQGLRIGIQPVTHRGQFSIRKINAAGGSIRSERTSGAVRIWLALRPYSSRQNSAKPHCRSRS